MVGGRGVFGRTGGKRPVALTGRGRELLAEVEQIYAELERGWAEVIGTGPVDSMRADLVRVLSGEGQGDGDGGVRLLPVRPPS